jgi:hypothetical protein
MDVQGIGLGPTLSNVAMDGLAGSVRSTRPGFVPDPPWGPGPYAAPGIALNLVRPSPEAVTAVVAAAFDADHYLSIYPDIRAAGVDPLQHFIMVGAAETRNPARWFDMSDYLAANPDVLASGFNPFWHYLVQGRAQGRPPRRLHTAERAAFRITRIAIPDGPTPARPPMACLSPASLQAALEERLTGAAGVVLSVSHDRYTRSVGGVQILVSDEQLAFNARGVAYLHIAPETPRLALAPAAETPFCIQATLDGAYLCTTTYADLAAVLAGLRPRLPEMRRLVLHCLLGHQAGPLAALHGALAPQDAVFWVNDYESICPGYNLLRNGVEFCGAPPPDSLACRVCVHGPGRVAHLDQIAGLFAAVPLHVVAPSPAALAVWQAGARLPHLSAQVHEYVALVPGPAPAASLPVADATGSGPAADGHDASGHGDSRSGDLGRGDSGDGDPGDGAGSVPVRVAFAGLPLVQKGWPAFAALAARLQGMADYKLFHLTAAPPDQPLPGVEVVPARVAPGRRGAMTEALLAHAIDLVLVLSPWPETFCLVAYEALAAGADLVALQDSGNVPDLVLRTGRGVVATDAEAVTAFFLSGGAARYVRLAAAGRRDRGRLVSRGMTSTLPVAGPAAGAG